MVNAQNVNLLSNDSFPSKDSVAINSNKKIQKKKGQLEGIVSYSSDKQIHDIKDRVTYLEKNAKVNYLDMNITGDYIEIDWDNDNVYAEGKKDSLGNIIENTYFSQGKENIEYGSFKLNFKTRQGTAYNVRTLQEGGVIVSEKVRRKNDSINFMRGSKYSTDTYYIDKKDKTPDYHIKADKIKYVQGKQAITGPVQLHIEETPTPLALPFFIFPTNQKRSAGFTMPGFGETEAQGFFFRNLGFYLPITQYADLKLGVDIFSKGSVNFRADGRYLKKYRYNGNLNFEYQNQVAGTKGLSDYNKATLSRFLWSHTQDTKANPMVRFSANVNYATSNYFQNTINSNDINNAQNYTNTTNSAVNVSKKFRNLPISATLSANMSQNSRTETMNLNLPRLTVNMERQYPFAKKGEPRKGLLKKTGFTYGMNQNTTASIPDSTFLKKGFMKDAITTVRHNFGLSTNGNFAKYFTLNLSANMNENWDFTRFRKGYDSNNDQEVILEDKGITTYRDANASAGVSTNLYGMVNFKKDKAIRAIRHVMTPSVNVSYSPDRDSDFFDRYSTYDRNGELTYYDITTGSDISESALKANSRVNFNLGNNLEMKVRNRKDTLGYKKIKLIEALNVSTSYDMNPSSIRNWSDISFNGSTSVLNNLLRVNFSGSVTPYKIDKTTAQFTDDYGQFNLNNYNLGLNLNLNNSTIGQLTGNKEQQKKQYGAKGNIRYENFMFDENQYARFDIPWSLSFQLNQRLNVIRSLDENNLYQRDTDKVTSLTASGNWSPSPYWRIGGGVSYDAEEKEVSRLNLNFSRDLRSFDMTFSWNPIGITTNWDFYIGIKASILRDALKYEEQQNNVQNPFVNP